MAKKKKSGGMGAWLKDAVKRIFLDIVATGKATAKGSAAAKQHAEESKTKKKRLTNSLKLEEALEILDVEEDCTYEEAKENFDHLFLANDEAKGGSFYLRSKVHNAWELLQEELELTPGKETKVEDEAKEEGETEGEAKDEAPAAPEEPVEEVKEPEPEPKKPRREAKMADPDKPIQL